MRVRLRDGLMHLETSRTLDGYLHTVACVGGRRILSEDRFYLDDNTLITCLHCMARWIQR